MRNVLGISCIRIHISHSINMKVSAIVFIHKEQGKDRILGIFLSFGEALLTLFYFIFSIFLYNFLFDFLKTSTMCVLDVAAAAAASPYGSVHQSILNSTRIKILKRNMGSLLTTDLHWLKYSETKDSVKDPAWTSSITKMSGDPFLEFHYPVIVTLLFCEHVVVLLVAVIAFVSAYKTSKLRPAIKKTRRRSVRPPLALPEASLWAISPSLA